MLNSAQHLQTFVLLLACSRLSDSGDEAKKNGRASTPLSESLEQAIWLLNYQFSKGNISFKDIVPSVTQATRKNEFQVLPTGVEPTTAVGRSTTELQYLSRISTKLNVYHHFFPRIFATVIKWHSRCQFSPRRLNLIFGKFMLKKIALLYS